MISPPNESHPNSGLRPPHPRAIASNWVKTPRHYLIRAQLRKDAENSANYVARSRILMVIGDWKPVISAENE